jgi:uncharacterized membrane protein YhaH (DUF805 family)
LALDPAPKKADSQFPRYGAPGGANNMEWMLMPLKRYAEFSGRSRRKEFWMFQLLVIIVNVVLWIIESALGLSANMGSYGPLSLLFLIATLIPQIAVGIRRLHDTDRSGWWVAVLFGLLLLVIGAILTQVSQALGLVLALAYCVVVIMFLVFMVLPGTNGPNRYGDDPKGRGAAEVFA